MGNYCDSSDDSCKGTIATSLARSWADRVRSLAQPDASGLERELKAVVSEFEGRFVVGCAVVNDPAPELVTMWRAAGDALSACRALAAHRKSEGGTEPETKE